MSDFELADRPAAGWIEPGQLPEVSLLSRQLCELTEVLRAGGVTHFADVARFHRAVGCIDRLQHGSPLNCRGAIDVWNTCASNGAPRSRISTLRVDVLVRNPWHHQSDCQLPIRSRFQRGFATDLRSPRRPTVARDETAEFPGRSKQGRWPVCRRSPKCR